MRSGFLRVHAEEDVNHCTRLEPSEMQSKARAFALVSVALLVVAALGPAVATGSPTAVENGTTVTQGDAATNETETDESDNNETESVFGRLVSAFVEDAKVRTNGTNSTNVGDTPLGLLVAAFVTENNHGDAPEHAGPPAHAGPGNETNETNRGPPENRQQGPPEDRGPVRDDETETENSGGDSPPTDTDDDGGPPANAGGKGGGPPADAGR